MLTVVAIGCGYPELPENASDLSLARLNEITQAWVERAYNRKRHSEIVTTPLRRFLDGKDVGLPSPTSEALRQAFCTQA